MKSFSDLVSASFPVMPGLDDINDDEIYTLSSFAYSYGVVRPSSGMMAGRLIRCGLEMLVPESTAPDVGILFLADLEYVVGVAFAPFDPNGLHRFPETYEERIESEKISARIRPSGWTINPLDGLMGDTPAMNLLMFAPSLPKPTRLCLGNHWIKNVNTHIEYCVVSRRS